MTIYDIKFEDSKTGSIIDLSAYKGKVIMLVNTASLCGFTKQYNSLQKIWERYQKEGFVLIAVPTDDFGGQEPGTNEEITSFCELNFGITFPIAKKVVAKGKNKHLFFEQVRKDFSPLAGPWWNFYKYIYSKDGKPLAWFSSITTPESHRITSVIEENLSKELNAQ